MKETSSIAIRYRYGSADTDTLPIRYRYEERTASVSETDIAYRYARDPEIARCEAQRGFWAWSTQEVGNLFPHWHAARLNPAGDTQYLINSWAMGLDAMKLAYAKYRRDLFIETADTTAPATFYHGPTVDYRNDQKVRNKNLLNNPSFSLRGLARTKLPLGWYGYGTGSVTLKENPTFVGTHSVKLEAEHGEYAYLRQRVISPIPVGTPITGSLWYMVPITRDAVEPSSVAGLAMHLVYADGTMETVRVSLALGTGGEWSRAAVTTTLTKELFGLTFSVYIDNNTGDDLVVYAGAAQLELSKKATVWEEGVFTLIPYIKPDAGYDGPIDAYVVLPETTSAETVGAYDEVEYTSAPRRKLTYLADAEIFWEGLCPSRATMTVVTDVPSATSRAKLGWYTTPHDAPDVYTTSWRIADDKIEQFNTLAPTEVIGSFDLAEFHLDGANNGMVGILTDSEEPDFVRTLEALIVHQNLLYIVCKEVYRGTTTRVLKIVNPHSQWTNPIAYDQGLSMYLEVIGDVDLGLSSGTLDYLGVQDENPDKLLARINDVYYDVEFEYDYFLFDADMRQVILRQPYDNGTLVTV